MEKRTELLHGHSHFKVLPDGPVDRAKVICNHSKSFTNVMARSFMWHYIYNKSVLYTTFEFIIGFCI